MSARARPRIALVHSILFFGSTERYLRELVRRIDRSELDLWLLAPDHPALAPVLGLEELAGRIATTPPPGNVLRSLAAHRRALRAIRPDLVHAIDVDPPAMLATRLSGVRRLVVTYHTPEHRPSDNSRGRLVRRLGWSTRPHVVFTSEPDRETAVALDPIPRERTSVIPFGIDFGRFSPGTPDRLRAELGIPDGRPVVGTVGLLRPQKAHGNLIRAAVQVLCSEPDVTFVVVGDGELRGELERQVREAGLAERFLLLGHRHDVAELVAGFDVFALSSSFEGMCFAVAEAMAMEKPVVATAVGGVPQSVVHEETGLLVPPRDPGALADALLRVLRHPEEARRMGVAGGERARALYALDRMVGQTTGLYRRLLA